MIIVKGSILDFEGDAIVNPANSFLNHAGGLAGVIDRAAQGNGTVAVGDPAVERWRSERRQHALVPVGGARLTSAGVLPFKGVIHAVGPVWGGGDYCERTLLRSAHVSAIAVALDAGFTSIAFPAISCGIFGFPVEEAAPIAVDVLMFAEEAMGVECSVYLLDYTHLAAYMGAALTSREAA